MDEILPVDRIINDSTENDYSGSPFLGIEDDIGISLVCHAAMGKNLQVKRHRRLIYEVSDGQRNIVFRQNSPGNSAVYTYCARQKHIAKKILASAGVPVPAGDIFESYEPALRYFQQSETAVTVKPCDGSSGVGVSCGINNDKDFNAAWAAARRESKRIIVEQNIVGQDVRVIVIGGKAVAAYVRTPAHVIGDGVHTIRQLVELKNRVRKNNPSLRLDLLRRFDLLERQGRSLDAVPENGEKVQLTTVANTSAGGETVQILDQLDTETLKVAEKAALCFRGLVQVGVDLIYVGRQNSPGQSSAYVIEVNSNPGICDAVFPAYGPGVDVPSKLLEHVFSLNPLEQQRKLKVSLAPPYTYSEFPNAFYRGPRRQVDLIKQAAYARNLEVEVIDEDVFVLHRGAHSCMFYRGMSEHVRMVSRKISRNRDWLNEVLPRSESSESSAVIDHQQIPNRLNRYRLLIVGTKLVAALHIRPESNGKKGVGQILRVDVSELFHPSLLVAVEEALQIVFDPFMAGVDIVMEDITRDISGQVWAVEDVVTNPFLSWHHFPDQGLARDVAGMVVRELFPEVAIAPGDLCCRRVLLTGQVQGVGFRRWMKLMAIRHGVTGWVRNLKDGRVEAMLEGAESGIAQVCELCWQGPAKARVDDVVVDEAPNFARTGFTALG